MIRKTILALAINATALTAAHAAFIPIDYDGAGLLSGTIQTSLLDWAPGNVLITPTKTGQSATVISVGDILQNYAQAKLSSIGGIDPDTGLFDGALAPSGLNTSGGYEWTYVMAFQEKVIDVTGAVGLGSALFNTIAGGVNFFEIYYGPRNSSNVNGTGFSDGTLVLSGTVLPYDPTTLDGETTFTATGVAGALDLFTGATTGNPNAADNYPGITSIGGSGGGNIAVQTTYLNPDFIKGPLTVFDIAFDTKLNLAFDQVDPSSCFWNGVSLIDGAGPNNAIGTECTTNTVGVINGFTGLNQVQQTDSSSSFNTTVPEPTSLALFGLGLIGLSVVGKRRRNT